MFLASCFRKSPLNSQKDIGKLAKASTRAAAIAGSEGAEAVLRTIGIAGNAARIGGVRYKCSIVAC